MNHFLRTWGEHDLGEIKKNLFVISELTGECFACHELGINLTYNKCPHCKSGFKYIAFRRKVDSTSVGRFQNKFPQSVLIDFDDFKKGINKTKAHKLLDL